MNTQEKITIALNAIALMSAQINNTIGELKIGYHATNGDPNNSMIWNMNAASEQRLSDAYTKLNEVAQDLGDYIDGQDAVEPETKNLINEHFKILNEKV